MGQETIVEGIIAVSLYIWKGKAKYAYVILYPIGRRERHQSAENGAGNHSRRHYDGLP